MSDLNYILPVAPQRTHTHPKCFTNGYYFIFHMILKSNGGVSQVQPPSHFTFFKNEEKYQNTIDKIYRHWYEWAIDTHFMLKGYINPKYIVAFCLICHFFCTHLKCHWHQFTS